MKIAPTALDLVNERTAAAAFVSGLEPCDEWLVWLRSWGTWPSGEDW